MTVLVLGCGPAGLIAATAADQMGYDVEIYSIKKKSPMPGAQYLHEPIPGVTQPGDAHMITYEKIGTREGYAAKVYGDPHAPCSWDLFPEGTVLAYPIGAIYDRLWERWEHRIMNVDLREKGMIRRLTDLYGDGDDPDLCVSAIPAPLLCQVQHNFPSATIHVYPFADRSVNEDTIVYNGDEISHWYRSSRLFGHDYTESPIPGLGSTPATKPLDTNCDCLSHVLKVGRFGAWKKGALVHHAYEEVQRALSRESV